MTVMTGENWQTVQGSKEGECERIREGAYMRADKIAMSLKKSVSLVGNTKQHLVDNIKTGASYRWLQK